jgi:hypothetical protein
MLNQILLHTLDLFIVITFLLLVLKKEVTQVGTVPVPIRRKNKQKRR